MINYTINYINKNNNNSSDIIYMFIMFIIYGLLCFIIIKTTIKIDEYINNEYIN
jgi:hypothetical protein